MLSRDRENMPDGPEFAPETSALALWEQEASDLVPGLDLTAITKIRHGDLWKAAKQFGGQAKLAEHLGVPQMTLSNWIRLESCPPAQPCKRRKKYTAQFLAELEKKLLDLTGKSLEMLFPESLRTSPLLKSPKTLEKEFRIHAKALESYGQLTRERFEALAEPQEEKTEQLTAMRNAMETLTYREREVLSLRYGLKDDIVYSLEEVSRKFRVTRETIRQIEKKAIRKIQSRAPVMDFMEVRREPKIIRIYKHDHALVLNQHGFVLYSGANRTDGWAYVAKEAALRGKGIFNQRSVVHVEPADYEHGLRILPHPTHPERWRRETNWKSDEAASL